MAHASGIGAREQAELSGAIANTRATFEGKGWA